ncbi:helix-turn-helix domain-containing protein [Patulibacter medicamentivorans]|uniref:helix-turn-helix domain-containing protein n=1 Tax=Patulibacter medicamentivorans TaxID=1097667 RepID=UPI00058B6BCF|nr:helix-turn-helix domain-containing protein [Patulibacter medicamentivorans]
MPTPPSPTIAPDVDLRIRAAAAHAGLSLERLASRLADEHSSVMGLSFANLRALGRRQPVRTEQLAAIADVTGMPLWYLVAGVDALDQAHRPDAVDTVPSEILSELRELRSIVDRIADGLEG